MKTFEEFKPAGLKIQRDDINHQFEEEDCYALWSAYAANRPLLLRGEPGTGKSQLAKAIARHLGWQFVSEAINGSTELSDLHWRYDAVARLGEAQTLALSRKPSDNNDNNDKCHAENLDTLNHANFLSPGPFWWAFKWQEAWQQNQRYLSRMTTGNNVQNDEASKARGVVLLIDEIDKADPDLPNGLLGTLGDLEFEVPYMNKIISGKQVPPLVIFTTNEERELPAAFKRRCFVHTLKMDKKEKTREAWLVKRGELHFGQQICKEAYQEAARILWQDRKAISDISYKPGLAEYIDLLKAISNLNDNEQVERLKMISKYVMQKEKDTD